MIRLLSGDEFRLVRLKTRRHYNPKGKTFQLLMRSPNVPPVRKIQVIFCNKFIA